MKTVLTEAIVLRRTNYGEADRIMTLLTKDHGKITVIAKGVRKEKSKLAGGIELFSVSRISFIRGKGDIDTLVSTCLKKHYDSIMRDYSVTQIGYDFLAWLNSITESAADRSYFDLLERGLVYLNEPKLDVRVTRAWFMMQVLILTGHEIELQRDTEDEMLMIDTKFEFDFESGRFTSVNEGSFDSNAIKFLRLLRVEKPEKLVAVRGVDDVIDLATKLLENSMQYYLPIKL